MPRNAYADGRAFDGGLSHGFRRVKKRGGVKFAGQWFYADELNDIIGDLVFVTMGDYWESYVDISTGDRGCIEWFCKALPK